MENDGDFAALYRYSIDTGALLGLFADVCAVNVGIRLAASTHRGRERGARCDLHAMQYSGSPAFKGD